MPNTLNEIPSKEDVELMDKLLVIDHNTEQSHNYAKFSKENDLDLTECNRISDLVGTWGVHFGLYTLTKDGHSILTWKSGKFIQSGGFTSKLNQLRATQEKEEERQVKQDNKLDLDIEVSERAIKFYKNRYWWLFGFTILGGLVGFFKTTNNPIKHRVAKGRTTTASFRNSQRTYFNSCRKRYFKL